MQTFTLSQLAERLGAELKGDPTVQIHGVATLKGAKSGELSFLTNRFYRPQLKTTNASVVIISKKDVEVCETNALIVDNPHYAYAVVAQLFDYCKPYAPGVHPSAIIGEDCHIDPSATIGPNVVIGDHVTIGKQAKIDANSVIENHASLGDECHLWPNVTIYHHVQISNRVTIHSGTVVGSDGFGFAIEKGRWHKVAQLGSVQIHDDVEIGANVSIDRGAIEDTIIEADVKLDNQIQVGHNVRIGAHTVIAGSTGIAGSTTIGKYCLIGGHVGISGHLTICDQVVITGKSAVGSSIDKPGQYSSGFPAKPSKAWWRIANHLFNIKELADRVSALEKVRE